VSARAWVAPAEGECVVAGVDGRTVVVTGAGRSLGREYALFLAREGARVVVNDLGAARDGGGIDASAADAVVSEIFEAGGQAVADHHSVADWRAAQRSCRQPSTPSEGLTAWSRTPAS
jgi:NAD(P)-dependent dehydrogenase (short-subunit alcohol dehydrogenase family)